MEQKNSSGIRWCDMRCEHAAFPEDYALDGAGSCRTFAAIYCRHLERVVPKNARCAAGLREVRAREV